MIDASFVKELERIALAGSPPKIIHPEQEPDHVYFLDGAKKLAEPADRNHHAGDLSAVVEFALANNGQDAFSVVWYSRIGVVCLLDDETRRDQVNLPLALSPQLATIQSWGDKSKPFDQAGLILLLRTMFRDCLAMNANLIGNLRQMKWTTGSDADSDVRHQKVSLGKTITAQLTGVADVPEEFTLRVPVFSNPNLKVNAEVVVALEIDLPNQRLVLLTLPGAVEAACVRGELFLAEQLADMLGAEYKSCYYGQP